MGVMILCVEVHTLALGIYATDAIRNADGGFGNGYLLSAYFFPPFWVPLFLGGALVAWIFERINLRPGGPGSEQFKSKLPGLLCDLLTLLFLARFVADIVGGIGQ